MGRSYTRIGHLLRLLQLIQSKSGMNIRDLAKACERHERTIYRDLATLNQSGMPCGYDEETKGYRVQPGFFMPPVELTFEEAMAMVALLEQLGDESQIPFLETAKVVAEKVRSQLPRAVLQEVESLDDHMKIDLACTSVDDSARRVYRQVRDAIATKRLLECTYDAVHSASGDGEATFEFRPYALWYCQRPTPDLLVGPGRSSARWCLLTAAPQWRAPGVAGCVRQSFSRSPVDASASSGRRSSQFGPTKRACLTHGSGRCA